MIWVTLHKDIQAIFKRVPNGSQEGFQQHSANQCKNGPSSILFI